MSKRTMRANSVSNTGTNITTTVRQFELTTDQPEESGGTDKGPTPVEYMLAGLSSCICTMVHMIAEKMELRVDSVQTKVEGDLDHMGVVDPKRIRPGLMEIRLKVDIEGDLEQEEKEKVLEQAENKCPVTDSLKNPVDLEFEISGQ